MFYCSPLPGYGIFYAYRHVIVHTVDFCCSAAQSSPTENELSNWASETRLGSTPGNLNDDHGEQNMEDQIGHRHLSGASMFMDLHQVIAP